MTGLKGQDLSSLTCAVKAAECVCVRECACVQVWFDLVKGRVAVVMRLNAGVRCVAEQHLRHGYGLGFGVWGLGFGFFAEEHLDALCVAAGRRVHANASCYTHAPQQCTQVTRRVTSLHIQTYMRGVLPLPVGASTTTPPSSNATSTSRWPSCSAGGWGLGGGGWGFGVWGLTFCTDACRAVRPA